MRGRYRTKINRLRVGDEFFSTEISRVRYQYVGRSNALFAEDSKFGVDRRPFHQWRRADGRGERKKGFEYTAEVWIEKV